MEFYITKRAQDYSSWSLPSNLIDNVIGAINEQCRRGILHSFKSGNPGCDDVPVFLVVEEDLGCDLATSQFSAIVARDYGSTLYFAASMMRLPLPSSIPVPKEVYDYVGIPEMLQEMTAEQAPSYLSEEEFYSIERKPNTNWLGMYCEYSSGLRGIFIRLDKTYNTSLLRSATGIASVIFHELGHAIMDVDFSCRANAPDAASYVVEEALANLIAYRSVFAYVGKRSADAKNVGRFMLNQPYPYPLGAIIGDGLDGRTGLDLEYCDKWMKLKLRHDPFNDFVGWLRQVLAPYVTRPFTTDDLKIQVDTLFGL